MTASPYPGLLCEDDARRAQVMASPTLQGIDFIEVVTDPPADNQFVLEVSFVPKTGPGQVALVALLQALDADPTLVRIEGGARVRGIEVADIDTSGNRLRVRVDKRGDFTDYTVVIDHAAMDPAYARCDFNFKAGCPSRFDCRPAEVCPPPERREPAIDYMARDYASFRQALLDLLPTLIPHWTERHEADLGIALVELLSYLGDHLSYYQDAVANEPYLETARQRVSVRRHAQLVDYRMHDGASARTFVHLGVTGLPGTVPAGTEVFSRIERPLEGRPGPHGSLIRSAVPGDVVAQRRIVEEARSASRVVFETMAEIVAADPLSRIELYTWGDGECCLPRGVTQADLLGDLVYPQTVTTAGGVTIRWGLRPGDFLLLEEVLGPETGAAADADRAHRQIVRLTSVETANDPLAAVTLTRVGWAPADALSFPLCVSTTRPDGSPLANVSVARGNLVLADHGRTIGPEQHPQAGPESPGIELGARAYRFRLREGPLSRRVPLPSAQAAASELSAVDARRAEPQVISLRTEFPPAQFQDWTPVPTLLESNRFQQRFVVEVENDGRALVRFGDDEFGAAPQDGARIAVTYRIGIGAEGNVGADSLRHVPFDPALPQIDEVRNPLSGWGGIDPEPAEEVKQLAPQAFRAEQLRAVTEADYARAAEKHPEVSRAVATFRWTGSWHTVFVAIDPRARAEVSPALERSVLDWIARFTQTGYDLELDPPTYVPLELELEICAQRDHFRAAVEEAVLRALSSRRLPEGGTGFFHPDRFTFAQRLYLSELLSAIEAVEGVDSVVATRFSRQRDPDPAPSRPVTARNVGQGFIPAGRLEILRVDNDPSFPEHGVLRLTMRGGK